MQNNNFIALRQFFFNLKTWLYQLYETFQVGSTTLGLTAQGTVNTAYLFQEYIPFEILVFVSVIAYWLYATGHFPGFTPPELIHVSIINVSKVRPVTVFCACFLFGYYLHLGIAALFVTLHYLAQKYKYWYESRSLASRWLGAGEVRSEEDPDGNMVRRFYPDNSDGKFYTVRSNPKVVREMATANSVLPSSQPFYALLVVDAEQRFIGNAGLVSIGKTGDFIATAKHCAGDADHIRLARNGKSVTLPLNNAIIVRDLLLIPVGLNDPFRSAMSLRSIPVGLITKGQPIRVEYHNGSGEWCSSSGLVSHFSSQDVRDVPGFSKHDRLHSASTRSGSSGSLVIQGKIAVGVHTAAVTALESNVFQPFCFMLTSHPKHPLNKALGRMESSFEYDVDANPEPDVEEYTRYSWTKTNYYTGRDDRDEFQQFVGDFTITDPLFKEMEREMYAVEEQGYGVHSREMKAVKNKWMTKYGRRKERETPSLFIHIDEDLSLKVPSSSSLPHQPADPHRSATRPTLSLKPKGKKEKE